jgi:hypothetical protein
MNKESTILNNISIIYFMDKKTCLINKESPFEKTISIIRLYTQRKFI